MSVRLCLICVLAGFPAAAEPTAKQVFSRLSAPSSGAAEPHGGYAKGCLSGARRLAETGPTWQAMRLGRNRNWGHPEAIAFIGRLGRKAREIGWPGLYIGDISQPRGGPMSSGHRSHQTGLDIDVWLARPAARPLSREERERVGSPSVVAANRIDLNANWTPRHRRVLKAAAEDPAAARIFVNPAIKRAMCRAEGPDGRAWLRKIRPWWGHESHFHVRLSCPADAPGCTAQDPPPPGDGCGATLSWWFSAEALAGPPPPGPEAKRELRLADLPPACRKVAEE